MEYPKQFRTAAMMGSAAILLAAILDHLNSFCHLKLFVFRFYSKKPHHTLAEERYSHWGVGEISFPDFSLALFFL